MSNPSCIEGLKPANPVYVHRHRDSHVCMHCSMLAGMYACTQVCRQISVSTDLLHIHIFAHAFNTHTHIHTPCLQLATRVAWECSGNLVLQQNTAQSSL